MHQCRVTKIAGAERVAGKDQLICWQPLTVIFFVGNAGHEKNVRPNANGQVNSAKSVDEGQLTLLAIEDGIVELDTVVFGIKCPNQRVT